jgi:predicted N-formylglutamate amidohydrolase
VTARRRWRPQPGLQLVVTCEHASAAVPAALGDLGIGAAVLRSHRGFDAGAAPIARALAAALVAPAWYGKWSRLVADLNRSAGHPAVIATRVDGRPVPANALDEAARARRLQRYWAPWRQAAEAGIRALVARGPVLHLSVHSFTPRLHGVERRADLGLLHDPRRPREVALCQALKGPLQRAGLSVRRNFPYFGDTDGFTTHLRGQLPAARYLGLEIECNQRAVTAVAGQRRFTRALLSALHELGCGPAVRS